MTVGATTPALCRDCAFEPASSVPRCPACGSPRLVSHPEIGILGIAHVDCDAFYATIEKRDDPRLADRPVIVGGGTRGVVLTACYVARLSGVRSAMPMFKALRLCPDATVVRPRMERYAEAARAVRALMGELTPLVQPISIDEAFLDLSGTERLHGGSPARSLAIFARRVEREVGITVSVGLACNKFLAKIASDAAKPRGFTVIGRADAASFLADRPVEILPGIGEHARARLERAGITRVRDLRSVAPTTLAAAAGRDADRLLRLARGEDGRRVDPAGDRKAVSAETTFSTDIASVEDLEPILWRLCEKVSGRLKASDLAARSVTLKLKDRSFRLTTRTRSGQPATQLAGRLFDPARALLRLECDGRLFRLVGVAAGDLTDGADADRGDLADTALIGEKRIDRAVDALRERFGAAAVRRGIALRDLQR